MTEALTTIELDETMRMFVDITEGLKTGYAALSARAEHVERELVRANSELERKVQELDEVKRHVEAILEALPTGVIVRDETGRVTRVNSAVRRITGAETPRSVEAVLTAAGSEEGDTRASFDLIRPDKQSRTLSSDSSPVFGPEEDLLGSVQILADRTEMTRLTERLHAVDKLAALGTMAGGIAHEIRNPLNAIQGFAELLRKELPEDTRARRWADLIVKGSEEANSIIRSLLGFARPDKLHLERVGGAALLDEVASTLAPADGSDTPWTIAQHAADLEFYADHIKLRQAIRNLVANALEAQGGAGQVDVDLFEEAGDIVIRVCDAGPGVAEDIRHRILDPFFTTRAEGTGLGLALSQSIAQLHGGRVEISPEPSPLGGAEIAIRLPANPCTP